MWNRAAKVADTEFIAIAEDDSLYHPAHFREYFKEFKPKPDEVVYDMSRWTVMSWHTEPHYYSLIRRLGGFMMIAPRKLVIGLPIISQGAMSFNSPLLYIAHP